MWLEWIVLESIWILVNNFVYVLSTIGTENFKVNDVLYKILILYKQNDNYINNHKIIKQLIFVNNF